MKTELNVKFKLLAHKINLDLRVNKEDKPSMPPLTRDSLSDRAMVIRKKRNRLDRR